MADQKTYADRKQEIRDLEASPGWKALVEDLTGWKATGYQALLTETRPPNIGQLQGKVALIEFLLTWPARKIKAIGDEETVKANRPEGGE